MSLNDVKSPAQFASNIDQLEEQNVKSKEIFPSSTYNDFGALSHKPQLEDFVFFATAQRAAERKEDGAM